MTVEWVHPGLLLILGAWVLPFLNGRTKRLAMLLLPAAAVVGCVVSAPGTYGVASFLGQELVFGRVDSLSLVFSYVFSLMAFLGMVYALHVEDDSQHVAALTYAGGALGVTFAGDFLSLYIFWELMAVSSVLLVWRRREESAVAAGFRYLLVHVVGGAHPSGGDHAPLVPNRVSCVRGFDGFFRRRAGPHPCRVPAQRGCAAAGGLASRRLPRSYGHRRGFHDGFHH